MRPTAEHLARLFGADSVGTFEAAVALPPVIAALPVVSPASLDETCEVLRAANREAWRLLPAGAGEHLGCAPLADIDLVLSARRLRRVVEYEPEEMVLVAEAGLPLHAIEALVAPHGQRLASDLSPGRQATIGGAVAAGRHGPNRRVAGTLRDALLGARVVHGDGRMSKTGGKVVKNVAGFDLGKLYAGSRGSLAFLAEVNLRLVPRPEASALVVARVERGRAESVLLAVHRAAVAPAALLLVAGAAGAELESAPGQVTIVVRFEGRAAALRDQVDSVCGLTGGEVWAEERAEAAYAGLRAVAEPRHDAVSLRISSLPVAGVAVLACLDSLAAWTHGAGCVAQFGVGTTQVQWPAFTARELRALRTRLSACGARVAVEHAPAGFDAGADPELDPVVLDLVRGTKVALDPEDRWGAIPMGGST